MKPCTLRCRFADLIGFMFQSMFRYTPVLVPAHKISCLGSYAEHTGATSVASGAALCSMFYAVRLAYSSRQLLREAISVISSSGSGSSTGDSVG